ncbi:MAG: hypothetical protein FGF52_01860 [Candidatus Brockarchaeota archaeon]|nr:hypothetical protein [Candidatus Brockarchaeota archaeon]
MPNKAIILIIVIIALISAFSTYQYYFNRTGEDTSRSERISLLMSLNLTDYETAILFDNKYSHLAANGKYNTTVLEFFQYWCLNQSLAEEYLTIFKDLKEANACLSEYYEKPKRISFLIEHANATELEAIVFDNEFNYLAMGSEYNHTVLEFFQHWRTNSSLAFSCLSILQNIEEANKYLSGLEKAATNIFSRDDLTIILSIFTDKEEYVANVDKNVNLTILILSNKNLENVAIDISGFKNRFNKHVVNNKWIFNTQVWQVSVNRGLNTESINIDIPCSPCYGIQSGLNNLTCRIKYDNLSLSVTKTFMFKSGS